MKFYNKGDGLTVAFQIYECKEPIEFLNIVNKSKRIWINMHRAERNVSFCSKFVANENFVGKERFLHSFSTYQASIWCINSNKEIIRFDTYWI